MRHGQTSDQAGSVCELDAILEQEQGISQRTALVGHHWP